MERLIEAVSRLSYSLCDACVQFSATELRECERMSEAVRDYCIASCSADSLCQLD